MEERYSGGGAKRTVSPRDGGGGIGASGVARAPRGGGGGGVIGSSRPSFESLELEDATTMSGGTSWTLRVPWMRNAPQPSAVTDIDFIGDDDGLSCLDDGGTVSSESLREAIDIGKGVVDGMVYYGGLMKSDDDDTSSNNNNNNKNNNNRNMINNSANKNQQRGVRRISDRQANNVINPPILQQQKQQQQQYHHQQHPPKRKPKRQKPPTPNSKQQLLLSPHRQHQDNNYPSARVTTKPSLAAGTRKNAIKARVSSWLSGRSSSARSTNRDRDEDSLADFDVSEWTPQDSAYGAAIPICGWIPKKLRQGIEASLIALSVLALVYLVVTTSISVSESSSKYHSSNDSSSGGGSSRWDNDGGLELDDDRYVEYRTMDDDLYISGYRYHTDDDDDAHTDDDRYADDDVYADDDAG